MTTVSNQTNGALPSTNASMDPKNSSKLSANREDVSSPAGSAKPQFTKNVQSSAALSKKNTLPDPNYGLFDDKPRELKDHPHGEALENGLKEKPNPIPHINGINEQIIIDHNAEGSGPPVPKNIDSIITANVSEIAWNFIQSYYTVFNKNPARIHCMYKKSSQMVHGHETDADIKPYLGQRGVHERISQFNYKNCRVLISSVDWQATLYGSILVLVLGELSNNGVAPKRFTQTFVLVEQSTGYYILNDIFRYHKEYPGFQSAPLPEVTPHVIADVQEDFVIPSSDTPVAPSEFLAAISADVSFISTATDEVAKDTSKSDAPLPTSTVTETAAPTEIDLSVNNDKVSDTVVDSNSVKDTKAGPEASKGDKSASNTAKKAKADTPAEGTERFGNSENISALGAKASTAFETQPEEPKSYANWASRFAGKQESSKDDNKNFKDASQEAKVAAKEMPAETEGNESFNIDAFTNEGNQESSRPKDFNEVPNATICIFGIKDYTTKNAINSVFNVFGPIRKIDFSPKVVFLEFHQISSATDAIKHQAQNGTISVNGYPVNIQYRRPRKNNNQSYRNTYQRGQNPSNSPRRGSFQSGFAHNDLAQHNQHNGGWTTTQARQPGNMHR